MIVQITWKEPGVWDERYVAVHAEDAPFVVEQLNGRDEEYTFECLAMSDEDQDREFEKWKASLPVPLARRRR